MKRTFKLVLISGFLLLLFTFLILDYFVQDALRDEEVHITSLYYDHEVMTALQEILISLQRAESNRRGYVITKDLQYVKNYNSAVEDVNLALGRLRSVGAMGIYHEKFLDTLENKVQFRIGSIKSSLQLFIGNSSTDSAQIALTDRGRDLMGSIRATILELLNDRNNVRDDSYRSIGQIRNDVRWYYQAALYVAVAILSFLSIMSYLYFRRLGIIEGALQRELFQTRQQVFHATSRYEKLLERSSLESGDAGKEE